jgi:hypothetical protein
MVNLLGSQNIRQEEIIMHTSIRHLITVASLSALASAAIMQGAQQCTFHLPVAAHWGKVLLQPGDYSLSRASSIVDQAIFRVDGAGTTAFEIPLLAEEQSPSDRSYLKLSAVGGDYFVREFSSGITGKTFEFSVPKEVRRKLASSTDAGLALAVK